MPARRPERKRGGAAGPAGAAAAVLLRHPAAFAGGATFALALGFVSVNALWFQPHGHPGALFATRAASDPALTFSPERIEPARLMPQPDPILRSVQASLQELGFHSGAVDGLDGPATRAAVAAFQQQAGLDASGKIDEALLAALEEALTGDEVLAGPSPEHTGEIGPPASGSGSDIRKLQAGLRAFGNEEVTVDGVLGDRTRIGLKQFQNMFGLPETGEPDPAVFAKMREIGLTD